MASNRPIETDLWLEDLFRPMGALRYEHASFFAGRQQQITELLAAIRMDGSAPVVYGDRGVGKSSLAFQVFSFLNGGSSALSENYRKSSYVRGDHSFFWIECNERIRNIGDILLRLLSPSGIEPGHTFVDEFPELVSHEIVERVSAARNYNALFQRHGTSLPDFLRSSDGLSSFRQILSGRTLDPFELFNQFVSSIFSNHGGRRLTVFVDEFDRLENKKGVGDFIKNISSIRFVLIGVGETTKDLELDHPSVERKIQRVFVPPFAEPEVREIFSIARHKIKHHPNHQKINYSKTFLNSLARDCGGYPYLAQLIGYRIFDRAQVLSRSVESDVDLKQVDYVNGIEQIFSSNNAIGLMDVGVELRKAVNQSTRRAAILKALTDFPDTYVSVSNLTDRLEPDKRRGVHDQLEELVNAEVLQQSKNDSAQLRFKSPYQKLAVSMLYRYKEKFHPAVLHDFGMA